MTKRSTTPAAKKMRTIFARNLSHFGCHRFGLVIGAALNNKRGRVAA